MKAFDCIEMKRRSSERIHERLKGLTIEERVAFWRKKNEETIARHRPRLTEGRPVIVTGPQRP